MSGEQSALDAEAPLKLVVDWRQAKTWRVFFVCWLAYGLFSFLAATLFAILDRYIAPTGKTWQFALLIVPFVAVQVAAVFFLLNRIPLRDGAGRPVPGDALRLNFNFPYAWAAMILWIAGLGVLTLAWMQLAGDILPVSERTLIAIISSQTTVGAYFFTLPTRLAGRVTLPSASDQAA